MAAAATAGVVEQVWVSGWWFRHPASGTRYASTMSSMVKRLLLSASFSVLMSIAAHAQVNAFEGAPPRDDLDRVLAAINGDRTLTDVKRLAEFGTRHTLSATDHPTRGIGAARRWLLEEMQRIAAGSDGRMTAQFQSSRQESPRIPGGAEIVNVVAIIRGTREPQRAYVVSGHYDSRASDVMDATSDAPGANDDASGTAVVLELARVLSRHPLDSTVILAAVAGEEQGLLGARGLADWAEQQGYRVEGMITNDVVGSIEGGDGRVDNRTVRVFSADRPEPGNGPSRDWAQFVRHTALSRVPNANVRLIYRLDRFGRGGDHRPFHERGVPAVRFTEAHENYTRQHQDLRTENGVRYGDTVEFVSGEYMALVSSVNAAAVWSAAMAPARPVNVKVTGAVTDNTTLTWDASSGAAYYQLMVRETTSNDWERAIDVPSGTSMTLRGFPIDNSYFGVRACNAERRCSPVASAPER